MHFKNTLIFFAMCTLALLLSANSHAEPPVVINIHGQLIASDGGPITGSRAFEVTFYDSETDGAAIGSSLSGFVGLSPEGLFNIEVEPPAGILTAPDIWYSLGVDTDIPADDDASDDIFPNRIRVFSVPFALQAQEVVGVTADRVGNGTVDDTEFDALDGVTSNLQTQLDAIDTSGIATNATNIATNTADIATNAANTATNTADIATNTANIATNTTNIAQNAADISQNTSDIATNAVNIATNTANIGANTTNIAQNASDIATNATNIATNTSVIDTNTTNIALNTANIALKANSADVYAKSAADTAFVDAAGDTMSGTLGVDTINEATADAGVTAEGVTLQDSYLALSSITAPGDTTDKLYNVGGQLFFNGIQVDATSVNKDAINNAGTLGFLWSDAEISDTLTLSSSASVDNGAFSALSDLNDESAIGTGAAQVAAGDHTHNLQDLGGAVTDAQVPDALTIQGGSVNNDSFSALGDLAAESAIGTGAAQVAAGDHSHNLQDLGGAVTDAQVPDNITITEADTLASVTARGATTNQNITLGGAAQSITFTNATGVVAINSDSALGLGLEGITILNGSMTNVGRTQYNNDSASSPAMTYSSDPDTGIHRPGANQLAMVTGGTARLTVDNTEVNMTGNILEIASGSAPGTTTNKLYNAGGNLYFNGTQLNGGGGSAAEIIWEGGANISNYGTTAYPYSGSIDLSQDIRHNQLTGVYSGPFPLSRLSRTITEIRARIAIGEAFPGAQRPGLQYQIRKISTGALEHNVTAVIDLLSLTADTWVTLPIDASATNRTVEPDEFLVMYTSTISGTDDGAGEIRYVQEVVVE